MEEKILARLEDIIREFKKANELALLSKKVLTLKEAAFYTGMSRSQIYQLTSCNKLKHYKPSGKNIFIKIDDLIEYLLQNPVMTNEEIEQKAFNQINRGRNGK
jgi:excisionase family DNA binding protein